jgi:protocatechuate 3,4-dioxygenase alpha subunit
LTAATSSQTIGPYWHLIEDKTWSDLTRFGATGEKITLTGRITDGNGDPVGDACVELWQPDPPAGPTWQGWGRTATDPDGVYRFTTLRPGPVAGAGNMPQAPHIAITLLARGLLKALFTRAYFDGDGRNEDDPLLSSLPPARRRTLIAQAEAPDVWRLDISLQGGEETVFLDI